MGFNIRVYGLCINENNNILLSDERRSGYEMTKFPGGGLENGEGTIECLKREFKEEMNVEIEVLEHFYTTDFYQQSAFKKDDQIISIYYIIRLLNDDHVNYKTEKSFLKTPEDEEYFRWKSLSELKKSDLTFPIDKHVANLLTN